jgi:hypothetical protein
MISVSVRIRTLRDTRNDGYPPANFVCLDPQMELSKTIPTVVLHTQSRNPGAEARINIKGMISVSFEFLRPSCLRFAPQLTVLAV